MFVISKSGRFEAAHRLTQVEPDHQCARLHGHSYEVQIDVAANACDPKMSWVIDYAAFKPLMDAIAWSFDHRLLNDVMGDVESTAEALAATITVMAVQHFMPLDGYEPEPLYEAGADAGRWWIHRVGVSETRNTWAWYYPEPDDG